MPRVGTTCSTSACGLVQAKGGGENSHWGAGGFCQREIACVKTLGDMTFGAKIPHHKTPEIRRGKRHTKFHNGFHTQGLKPFLTNVFL